MATNTLINGKSEVEAPQSYKNILFDDAQINKKPVPSFNTYRCGGTDHVPLWVCTVVYDGNVAQGTAQASKIKAEQEAAALFYRRYMLSQPRKVPVVVAKDDNVEQLNSRISSLAKSVSCMKVDIDNFRDEMATISSDVAALKVLMQDLIGLLGSGHNKGDGPVPLHIEVIDVEPIFPESNAYLIYSFSQAESGSIDLSYSVESTSLARTLVVLYHIASGLAPPTLAFPTTGVTYSVGSSNSKKALDAWYSTASKDTVVTRQVTIGERDYSSGDTLYLLVRSNSPATLVTLNTSFRPNKERYEVNITNSIPLEVTSSLGLGVNILSSTLIPMLLSAADITLPTTVTSVLSTIAANIVQSIVIPTDPVEAPPPSVIPTAVDVVSMALQQAPLWIGSLRQDNAPIVSGAAQIGELIEKVMSDKQMRIRLASGQDSVSSVGSSNHKGDGPGKDDLKIAQELTNAYSNQDVIAGLVSMFGKELTTPSVEYQLLDVLKGNQWLLNAVKFTWFGVIPTSNSFEVLSEPEIPTHLTQSVMPAMRKSATTQMSKKPDEVKKIEHVPAIKKPIFDNCLKQRANVERRVLDKLRKKGDDAVVEWLLSMPENKWSYSILNKLWGPDWDAKGSWAKWFASFYLCRKERSNEKVTCVSPVHDIQKKRLEMFGYSKWSSALKQIYSTKEWADYFEQTCGSEWHMDESVYSAEADAHNKNMHSYNGNPRFSGGMKDILMNPKYQEMYRTPLVAERYKPWVAALEIQTVPSSVNPTDQDVRSGMCLRGDYVAANNITQLGVQLPAPESMLKPRQVRNGVGAALVNSANRLCPTILGAASFQAVPLSSTELMNTIMEAAIKANQNLGRSDNVTLGGFHAFDVAYVARLKAYYGLTLESALVKLALLQATLSWGFPVNTLPLSMQASHFDPYTQIDPQLPLLLSYNDSPTFGEACGFATSRLPFRDIPGQVFFHLTLATVPESERSTAIFMPANLLLACENGEESIPIFMSMFTDWPTVMWTVSVPTTDDAGGNAAYQLFIPNSSNIFVPGLARIHLILPRRTTSRNPEDQATANSLVLVRPKTGTIPSTNLVADTLLNVNYVNGPLQGYNLAQFMYTWMISLDSTSVANFIQRLHDVVDIKDTLDYVYEKVACLVNEYAPLQAVAAGAAVRWPVNANTTWEGISPLLAVKAPQLTADYPLTAIGRPDFLVSDTDIVAINKVFLQVAISTAPRVHGGLLNPMLGHPLFLYWTQLISRSFAILSNVHFCVMGWTARTWQTAYQNTIMQSFREIARGHYSDGTVGTLAPHPTRYGRVLASLYTALFHVSPVRDLNNCTILDYICAPRNLNRSTIYRFNAINPVSVNGVAPVFLSDVWIYQMVRDIPMGCSAYTPQNNYDSTVGIMDPDMCTVILGNGQYSSLYRPVTNRTALNQRSTRDDTDAEIFNSRLFSSIVNTREIRELGGAALANTIQAGELVAPCARAVDFSIPNLVPLEGTISTFWLPRVNENGRFIFPADAIQNVQQALRILTGISRAALPIWALNGIVPANDIKMGPDAQKSSMWYELEHSIGPALTHTQGGDQLLIETISAKEKTVALPGAATV